MGAHAQTPGQGLSTQSHAHPQTGVGGCRLNPFPFGRQDTSHQATGAATLGTPKASAQGLIYQRDRSRCQGLPQKSAGLEMQRTKTLRCSGLTWSPRPLTGPCSLSPRSSMPAQAGRAWSGQVSSKEKGTGRPGKGRAGEGRRGRTPTQKRPDKEVGFWSLRRPHASAPTSSLPEEGRGPGPQS